MDPSMIWSMLLSFGCGVIVTCAVLYVVSLFSTTDTQQTSYEKIVLEQKKEKEMEVKERTRLNEQKEENIKNKLESKQKKDKIQNKPIHKKKTTSVEEVSRKSKMLKVRPQKPIPKSEIAQSCETDTCDDTIAQITTLSIDEIEISSQSKKDNDRDKEVNIPIPLSELYCKDYQTLTDAELEEKCEEVMRELVASQSLDKINKLEELTRNQSDTNLWYKHRIGRITASMAHKVFRRKPTTRSNNLIVDLMGYNFKSLDNITAIKWGKENEDKAREAYCEIMTKKHQDFSCRKSGLMVSITEPFLGASADGFATCSCHSSKVVEIKCPHKFKDIHPLEAAKQDSSFCLTVDGKLKTNHPYYTQVQMQIFCNRVKFADFVCYTLGGTVVCEDIAYDVEFINNVVTICDAYFKQQVLPELLTRKIKSEIDDEKPVS